MSDKQNVASSAEHKAEFHIGSELEAMETVPSSAGTSSDQPQMFASGLVNRRGLRAPEPLAIQLVKKRRPAMSDHRPRSYSVPTLVLERQNQSIGSLLKRFGDEYFEAKSPRQKQALSQSSRRRSSADFGQTDVSWLNGIFGSIFRRLSGAQFTQPPEDSAATREEDTSEFEGADRS